MSYTAAAARPPPPKNSDSLRSSESHGNPRHVHHATDAYNNERPIWIYVDDSNIWITAKKLAAKRMKTKEDHRIRIDIGRLTDVVAKGRVVAHGFLYGFEPPPVDTVWEKIKERGWDVPKPKRRSAITGKEKGVDAQLVADITELACTTPEEERTTIIIISGDADVMPAIHKLLKYRGWSVEVCMWEDAMSNDLKKLPQREPKVVVNYLDKFLEHITFTNMKFNPRHLHSCEKATAVVFQMKPKAFPDRVPSNKWCRVLQSITQWPFQYYWAELNGRETNDLVLVFRDDGKHSFDLNSFMAQIKEYPIQRTLGAQTYVQYDQEKSGLYRMELDKVGQIHYDEACDEGYESEASAILDSDDDAYDKLWQIKRRLPPPRKTPLYSELCPFRINCKFGLKCLNKHTEDEKRFFRTNQGEGNPLRKVKPCLFHPNCKKEMKECHYAHGEEDAWCLSCRDMCGHYTQNCPQLKKSQNDD